MSKQATEPYVRMFRLLTAADIELKINTVTEKGVTLLIYKNARCDQKILDETVGPMNWQRDHKELKNVMYCGVAIWDKEKLLWVWKWDAGTESATEGKKGEASDSFKRACFSWGLGRELYSAPRIFLPVKTHVAGKKPNGKPAYEMDNPYELTNHHIKAIGYNASDEINFLQIADASKVVWKLDAMPDEKPQSPAQEKASDKISTKRVEWLRLTADGEERYQTRCNTILADYAIEKIEDITNSMFEQIVAKVKKGEL